MKFHFLWTLTISSFYVSHFGSFVKQLLKWIILTHIRRHTEKATDSGINSQHDQRGRGCRGQQETTIVELPRLKTTGTRFMCLEVGSRRRKREQKKCATWENTCSFTQALWKSQGPLWEKSDRRGVIDKHIAWKVGLINLALWKRTFMN